MLHYNLDTFPGSLLILKNTMYMATQTKVYFYTLAYDSELGDLGITAAGSVEVEQRVNRMVGTPDDRVLVG